MSKRLHKDWPLMETEGDRWGWGAPLGDLDVALEEGVTQEAAPGGAAHPQLTIEQIESIEQYHVSYHGTTWTPSDLHGGTELNMVILGKLKDGRWFSVSAGNDYTGWGCQDGSDVRVGATRDDVVRFGLTREDRGYFGIDLNA